MTDDREQTAVNLMEAMDVLQTCLGVDRGANRYINVAIANTKKAIDRLLFFDDDCTEGK